MLEVKELGFRYKKKFELKEIHFSLEDGYLMCLLGKNGAGKTTLLKLLYGILMPQNGSVVVDGLETVKKDKLSAHTKRMAAYHKTAAYVQADLWCGENLTVTENIELLKLLYEEFDRQEFEDILGRFDFTDSDKNTKYQELSTGQKMQVQLAFHLARHPKLLLMDEPLANLDPVAKEDILELLREKIAKENLSVLLSTHLVEEISEMTDYIGILENGRLKAFGDREEIFETFGTKSLRELLKGGESHGL